MDETAPDATKRMLKQVTDLWQRQIELCHQKKEKDFAEAAREVMHFVGKRYAHANLQLIINGVPMSDPGSPQYLTVMNYSQAFVDILTPYVFAKVPTRLTLPIVPQLPPELQTKMPEIDEQQSAIRDNDSMLCFLLQRFLSWTPKLYGLKREGKMAAQESLGKGMSCLWVQMGDGPTGEIPISVADSIDNYYVDSDCIQRRDASFIVRRVEMQTYRIAETWGEDLKGMRGTGRSAMLDAAQNYVKDQTSSQAYPTDRDVGVYYEIWSRIGLGQDLVGAGQEINNPSPIRSAMEQVGPYVHFAIMPGLDHPLGMAPEKFENLGEEEVAAMLQKMMEWPIKTYGCLDDPWPVTIFEHKPNIENPYAKPPLECALPLQQFIDFIFQRLMKHADVAGRCIIVTAADAEQAVVDAIHEGKHMEMIKINSQTDSKSLSELVGYLVAPEMKKDVFTILSLCDKAFRELTGMDPSIFGGIPSSQDRSAEATKSRTAGIARRPDDYADSIEEAMGMVAAKEAIAARMLVEPTTIAPLFREQIRDLKGQMVTDTSGMNPKELIYGPLTTLWMSLVHTDSEYIAASECEYTVAAGSGRRRNKQLQQESAQQIYEMMSQQLYAIAEGTGNYEPYLALIKMVGEAYENTEIDAIIQKIREWQAQQQMAMQQQAQQGQPGQPAEGGQYGGQGPGQEQGIPGAPGTTAGRIAGGSRIAGAWQKAAGGPPPRQKIGPPPNAG